MSGHRARWFGARSARAWPLAVALVGTACSWLVNPENDAPRCAMDGGTDPCGEGMHCLSGRCRVLDCSGPEICGDKIDNDCDGDTDEFNADAVETCNNADDDCDGMTDEDFDVDQDGFTWCGDISGRDDKKDCDEINPNVHPNAKEECDGIDNNCNQLTDEVTQDDPLCTKPERCFQGSCIVPSCAIEGSGVTCRSNENCVINECVPAAACNMMCPEGTRCDPITGTCTTTPPPAKAKNGAQCTVNADCISELCLDAAALRMPGRTGRICGKACCRDTPDCEADEVCFASGTGARSCMPRSEAPSAKQCSNDDACKAPERCVILPVTQTGNEARAPFSTGQCRAPSFFSSAADLGATCLSNEGCISKLCVPNPLSALFRVCSTPCQISSDCSEMYQEQRGFGFAPLDGAPHEYCRFVDYAQLAGGAADSGDHIAACVMGYDTGDKNFGERCSANNNCADGVCIMNGPGSGYCAPTCCNDLQCSGMGAGHENARCIPMARGKHYEMRCSL